MNPAIAHLPLTSPATDEQVVEAVLQGDQEQFAVLMRRYNQRLYRTARAITKNEADAEDVVQQAFVAAYKNLAQFEGRAKFSTWLTRIAVNEALTQRRKSKRMPPVELEVAEAQSSVPIAAAPLPESRVAQAQASRLLELAFDQLAEGYRSVYVLREVEELTTAEAADVLGISEEAVRVRLHRARASMREILLQELGLAADDLFPFAGARCDRALVRVFAVIGR